MDLDFISVPVLRTRRLLLREVRLEDAAEIFALCSDPLAARFDCWEPVRDSGEARRLILEQRNAFQQRETIPWGMADPVDDRLCGLLGLFDFDHRSRKCVLSFQVARERWNRGYATEGIGAVVEFAFSRLGANRVEAYVTPGNDASIRVLEKNGFRREGLLREMEFYRGRYWDGILMAVLRRDLRNAVNQEGRGEEDG